MARHTAKATSGHPTQTDAIAAMLAEGLEVSQIIQISGINRDSVYSLASVARRRGLPPGPWTAERTDKAQRLLAETLRLISDAVGVTPLALLTRAMRDGWLMPGAPGAGAEAAEPDAPVAEPEDGVLGPNGWQTRDGEPSREDDEADLAALEAESDDGEELQEESGSSEDGLGRLFRPSVSAQVRLRNETGEYLHENGRTLTRIARFYWVGSQEEAKRLKRSRPHFKDLFEVAA